jgi:hypothetical protein
MANRSRSTDPSPSLFFFFFSTNKFQSVISMQVVLIKQHGEKELADGILGIIRGIVLEAGV